MNIRSLVIAGYISKQLGIQRILRLDTICETVTRLDLHFKDALVRAADLDVRLRVVHANPLGPGGHSVGIRAQQNMTVFRDRTRNPFQFQREKVEVGRTLGKLDRVLAVVASCILVGQLSIGPRPHKRQLAFEAVTENGYPTRSDCSRWGCHRDSLDRSR